MDLNSMSVCVSWSFTSWWNGNQEDPTGRNMSASLIPTLFFFDQNPSAVLPWVTFIKTKLFFSFILHKTIPLCAYSCVALTGEPGTTFSILVSPRFHMENIPARLSEGQKKTQNNTANSYFIGNLVKWVDVRVSARLQHSKTFRFLLTIYFASSDRSIIGNQSEWTNQQYLCACRHTMHFVVVPHCLIEAALRKTHRHCWHFRYEHELYRTIVFNWQVLKISYLKHNEIFEPKIKLHYKCVWFGFHIRNFSRITWHRNFIEWHCSSKFFTYN